MHTFKNIRVNELGQLYQGKLESKESTGNFMTKIENPRGNPVANNNDTVSAPDTTQTSSIIDTLPVNGTINAIYSDTSGNVVIVTANGDTTTKKIDKPTLVADGSGNTYIVSPNGNITRTGEATPSDTTATEAKNVKPKNPVTVYFSPDKNQQYGFDQFNSTNSTYKPLDDPQYYPREEINDSTYYKPWKSIFSGGTDVVKVKIARAKNDTAKINLKFTDGNGNNLTLQDSSLVLNGNGYEGTQEITATYTESDTSKNTFTAGKFGLVSYSDINNPTNVFIVPVGAQSNSISTGTLQTTLDNIYRQANKTFAVSSGPSISFSNQSFDANPPDAVSYTDDMVDLIDSFQSVIGDSCEANNYYLFLLDHCNDGKAGIMPFNQNFGFIFTGGQSGDVLNRTIAHELGHGAFGLLHTFHTFGHEKQLDSAKTDNLMDYAGGTRLFKYQWDEIHYPANYTETIFGTGTTGADVASISGKCSLLELIRTYNYYEQTKNLDAYTYLVKSPKEWKDYSIGKDKKLSYLRLSTDVNFLTKQKSQYMFQTFEISKNNTTSSEAPNSSDSYVDFAFHATTTSTGAVTEGDKIFHFTVFESQTMDFVNYAFPYVKLSADNVTWVAQNDIVMKGTGCHWCSSLTTKCCDGDAALVKCAKDSTKKECCPPDGTNKPDYNNCCCYTCNYILSLTGHSTSRSNAIDITTLANESAKDYNTLNYAIDKDFQKAKNYIDESLLNKVPVIVGVHLNSDKASGNSNSATYHFVVIVGREYESNQKLYYYYFYEVGTSNPKYGTSSNNKLFIYEDQRKISGTSEYNNNITYTITEVRTNN